MFGQDFAIHLTHSTAVYMFSTIVISYANFQYLVDRIVIFITSTSSLFLGTQEHYVQINIRVANGDRKYNPRFIRVKKAVSNQSRGTLALPSQKQRWYQMYRKMGMPQRHYQHCQQKNLCPCWKQKSVSPVIKRIQLSSSKRVNTKVSLMRAAT